MTGLKDEWLNVKSRVDVSLEEKRRVRGMRKSTITNGEPWVDSEGSRGLKGRMGKALQSATMVGATGWRRPGIHWFGVGAGREGLNGGVELGEDESPGSKVIARASGPQ